MSERPVSYEDVTGTLRERATEALGDEQLRTNLRASAGSWAAGRKRMDEQYPFQEMREKGREIRTRAVAELPQLLDQLEENLTATGGVVYRAADAAAACRYVVELAQREGADLVAKSKSMATEEIKLNEALEEAGLRVVETDLGEWIIQLAGQHPSHIVAPAVHLNREEVADLFEQESGGPVENEREALVAHARQRLREVFATAQIGVSGVNLAVAESGTICVVENEGNGRLVTALPRIHVAVMGMERIVGSWEDAAHILELLPMAAIGDDAAGYVNLITGPRRPDETDGPEQFHLVIVDGGRSALRGGPFEEILNCIRCGACLYACPMWKSVGGQAYGSPYSGPIGAVLTPVLEGPHASSAGQLPHFSSLCGACHEACPVGIPIHDLLVKARGQATEQRPRSERVGMWLWSRLWSNPVAYGIGRRLARAGARVLGRRGWIERLPGPAGAWTSQRDVPTTWPPKPPSS